MWHKSDIYCVDPGRKCQYLNRVINTTVNTFEGSACCCWHGVSWYNTVKRIKIRSLGLRLAACKERGTMQANKTNPKL